MAMLVHILDETGRFELIDEAFGFLYPQLALDTLPTLSEAQHQTYLANVGAKMRFIDGELQVEKTVQDLQAVIFAEKSAKLAEINAQAQAFINQLAKYDETPPFERDTWSIQREEAKAWFADKDAPTPTLAVIAQMRGVPLTELRQKAYEKAVAYQTVAAIVAGQRQAYEDRLNAAETLAQIQAIEVMFSLPQGADE